MRTAPCLFLAVGAAALVSACGGLFCPDFCAEACAGRAPASVPPWCGIPECVCPGRTPPEEPAPLPADGGCDGGSQACYELGGCPNTDDGCPRLTTVHCALEAIRSKYDGCATVADCAEASINARCTGYGSCPPAYVSATYRATFELQASAEIDRYCGDGGCAMYGSCGYPPSHFVPACILERCSWQLVDGGP